MKFTIRILLQSTSEQLAQLLALQQAFAQVCNALAPTVQKTRCWNRVALHHMVYKELREKFPAMGSQMVCNAIYSVSRTSRLVYQHPQSPFNLATLGDKPVPLLVFTPDSPVYFDRHTLSLKNGQLSLYTLDGRLRFSVNLPAQEEQLFGRSKLREVVLARTKEGLFELVISLSDDDEAAELALPSQGEIPEYVLVEETV